MMRLLTTLLLFCMSFSLHAQDVTANEQAQEAVAIAGKVNDSASETTNIYIDYDEDNDYGSNEKMSVSVKEKRQSDAFIDVVHVKELLLAFLINLIAILIIVRGLYYPKCKRGEFFFTYILIAISTFMLIYVLGDVKLKAGIALGLFAIFSIIRYRTEQVAIREMTYLFIIIALV